MLNIDLHMLRVLDEIYRTGSLSRAADRLGVTQPSVSMALSRMRIHFQDQLFTRVGHEMKPTPQAEGMRSSVAASIAAIEETVNYRLNFEPFTTQRTFRISVTDIGQIVMVPKFLEQFHKLAPKAGLEFTSIDKHTPMLLQTGEIDLAVGVLPSIPQGLYQQTLFKERFVCLAQAQHPRITSELTLAQLKSEAHVVVMTSSSTHVYLDKVLEEQQIKRRVAVRVPNFILLSHLIATTEHLSILPSRAGISMVKEDSRLTVHSLPLKLPQISITQYWHERQLRDPGHRWVRDLFTKLFREI